MRSQVVIDTRALRHNLEQVRSYAPQASVLAVIKANAYGHGMLQTAEALSNADAFAVASVEEGMQLRQSGIDKPVLVLQGVIDDAEWRIAAASGLDVVVHQAQQLELIETAALAEPADVWLKIDTGMHRLGFAPDQVQTALSRLQQCGIGTIRLMSHFANADDVDDVMTAQQLKLFEQATANLPMQKSIANSAAICSELDCQFDWVRPGIMLYGANPFISGSGADLSLQPVMTFSSTLMAINHHQRGDAIGYGGRWVCPEDMPVGVVSAGYGDGYPRHAEDGTPVLVNGRRVPLVGRVSMDMLCVDLRSFPDARIGDPVVLWGQGLPAEEIAYHANTIPYELFCKLTGRASIKYL